MLPYISKDVSTSRVMNEEEAILRAQQLDLIYSQAGILYEVKFPCKLCHEDHLTHLCPLMDQAQKLLKAQQPTVLKDPFPQGENYALASNVAGGTQSSLDPNYINIVRSLTLLQTRNRNYEKETPEKGKAVGETSNPLTIEKPAETM